MSQEAHLTELEKKHRMLDQEIQHERTSPAADPLRLASMKRRKLLMKDQIEQLKARLTGKTVH
jgi:hypothetical protein